MSKTIRELSLATSIVSGDLFHTSGVSYLDKRVTIDTISTSIRETLKGALVADDDLTIETGGLLKATSDIDAIHEISKVKVWGASDVGYISHFDYDDGFSYAIKQDSTGSTQVNAASGRPLIFGIGNTQLANITSGSFYIGIPLEIAATGSLGERLSVGANTDISATIGRGKLGYFGAGYSNVFTINHVDATSILSANVRMGEDSVVINASSSGTVGIRNDNTTVATFSGSAINMYKPVEIKSTGLKITRSSTTQNSVIDTEGGAFNYRANNTTATTLLRHKWYQSSTSISERLSMAIEDDGSFNIYGGIEVGQIKCHTVSTGAYTEWMDTSLTRKAIMRSYGTIQMELVVGGASNTTGVWAVSSDERVKENIEPITNPLEKVRNLAKCVRHFNYISEMGIGQDKRTQYIAQSLEEYGFAGHVSENIPNNEEIGTRLGWEYTDEEYKDGDSLKTRRIVVKEGDMLKRVENNFAPYFAPAIVEVDDKVIALEQENIELKARIEALEEKLGR